MPDTHRPRSLTIKKPAQILGVSLALSISGAIFVNTSLGGLKRLLPDVPHQVLQDAIAGLSGGFFSTLPAATQRQALQVIMDSLQKV